MHDQNRTSSSEPQNYLKVQQVIKQRVCRHYVRKKNQLTIHRKSSYFKMNGIVKLAI